MQIRYHIDMTREALTSHFSERALEIILAANVKQDSIRNQFGRDEIHYDNNAIEKGNRYINEQRGYLIATLLSPGILGAWIAFGRLVHTGQDFYAHSNYITMWLDQFDGAPPPPAEIEPYKKELVRSPNLRSGKIYFPMDWLYFIKPLRPLMLKLLPRDSHGWMNLDSPEQGPKFEYAMSAGTKRTVYEFELLQKLLTPEMFARFTDR